MWFFRRTSLLLLCASLYTSHVHVTDASGAAAAAANALKTMDYRYFVAGGICAATSHGITTPVDVIKTKMQADPELYEKGIRRATLSIIKTDGPQVLLGGLGPTVVGYGMEGAMKFGVYEVLKPVFQNALESLRGSNKDATAAAYICASVVAGAVASAFLCPMESTRIKIVTDPDYKGLNMVEAFQKLCNEDGFLSTFGGMYAMLAKQVSVHMLCFERPVAFVFLWFHDLPPSIGSLYNGETSIV